MYAMKGSLVTVRNFKHPDRFLHAVSPQPTQNIEVAFDATQFHSPTHPPEFFAAIVIRYKVQQLVCHFMCGEVQVGEICLRCDGLAGPCMVLFGAAWVFWRCMYKYWTLAVMYTRRNQFAIPLTLTFVGTQLPQKLA